MSEEFMKNTMPVETMSSGNIDTDNFYSISAISEETSEKKNTGTASTNYVEKTRENEQEQVGSDDDEIDIVNIFSNMKKKKNVYIWALVCAVLIGFTIPFIMLLFSKDDTEYTAVLTYNYEEAKDLKSPDGTDLDTGIIKSSYIIQTALGKCRLKEVPPVNSVSNNISVKRMISEETKQQLEVLEKIDSTTNINDPTKYMDAVSVIDYIYKPQYVITLKNGFALNEKDFVYLSEAEMKELLSQIVTSYKEYFHETYATFMLPDNRINDISLDELDYIEWLDNINDIMASLSEYCTDEEKGSLLDYNSSKDGLTLKDIGKMVDMVKDIKVDYIYSYVYCDSLVKDKDLMLTKYEYTLREYQRSLDVVNENIRTNDAIINEYKNNNILINRGGQSTGEGEEEQLTASTVSDYFNSLVMKQADNYVQKAAIEKKIADVNDKILGITKRYSSKSKYEEVDREIQNVNESIRDLYGLVRSHAEEILESDSYANTYMSYIDAQGKKESMISKGNLKKLGIGAGVGLILVLCIWFADGFIEELKRSSKKSSVA